MTMVSSGGHDAEAIAAAQHLFDDFPLPRTEVVETEEILQLIDQLIAHGWDYSGGGVKNEGGNSVLFPKTPSRV
jgi:hypothetical protein